MTNEIYKFACGHKGLGHFWTVGMADGINYTNPIVWSEMRVVIFRHVDTVIML